MTDSDWTVQILTPTPTPWAPEGIEQRDDAFRQHSEPGPSRRGNQVVEASVETLKANWHETVKQLTAIGDGIDDDKSKWGVSEIEIGLTLSAKGQLLFIAEAGAEASVKIKLSRRS